MYLTHGLTYVKLLTRLRFIATGIFQLPTKFTRDEKQIILNFN